MSGTSGGHIIKRCYCRDENRKPLGKSCPQLKSRKHGKWMVRQELPVPKGEKRKAFTRSGFDTRDQAQEVLDQVRALLALPTDTDNKGIALVSSLLQELSGNDKPIPDPAGVAEKVRRRQELIVTMTTGEWLDTWLAAKRKKSGPGGYVQAESQIRVHLKPHLGDIPLAELNIFDLEKMFTMIEENNEAILANNALRREVDTARRAATTRAEQKALRARLRALPPFRRVCGPVTRRNLRANLRSALNDAIPKLISFNPAVHVDIGGASPKAQVWTEANIDLWQQTGVKPSPVMVWTTEHAGLFLDLLTDHPLYPLFHLAVYRGPRRGECCGFRWSAANLDDDPPSLKVVTQLTTLPDWSVHECPPKADSTRTLALDKFTADVLRKHRAAQNRIRLRSLHDRIFTDEEGKDLHPGRLYNEFRRLLTRFWRSHGLPPIRFHDLRHTAATIMLAAGNDMKTVSATLGHSSLGITADTYTSVLPVLAAEAAERSAAIIPIGARRASAHATLTPEAM